LALKFSAERIAVQGSDLREITNNRVRNLVRGALAAENEDTLRRTLEGLRQECGLQDAAAAFRHIQQIGTSRSLPDCRPFPMTLREIAAAPDIRSQRLDIELAAQAVRYEGQSDRLVAAIGLVQSINASLLATDVQNAARLLEEYRHNFGLSLFVSLKAASGRNLLRRSDPKGAASLGHGDPLLMPRRHLVVAGAEDALDQDRDYIQVRRAFLNFVADDRIGVGDGAVLADLLSPLGALAPDYAQRLQAFGRWSLLDTTAFLFRLEATLHREGRTREALWVSSTIPDDVREAWRSAFFDPVMPKLETLLGREDQFYERTMFSHLTAWSEYDDARDYRLRIEGALGRRLDGFFLSGKGTESEFVDQKSKVADLLAQGADKTDWTHIRPEQCGAFHRSIALASSIEVGLSPAADGEELAALLDQTIDVAKLLSPQELRRFLPRRPDDLLFEFLRAAVLSDQEEGRIANHSLRRALQNLVQARFENDIVRLVKHLDTPNGHVASHLYAMCTESFLTELYDLYDEAGQVTEAQAAILEWRASNRNDVNAASRARSHRLNLRLRKVRGAIDETRIYVDPLRFTEWVQESFSSELRVLSAQADEILADDATDVGLKDRVRVAIQPRMQLMKLLDDCYAEFCTNKIYGVTSFIGRRIRHGTLYGHLVLELKPQVEAAIEEFRDSAPRFSSFLESWFKRFAAAVTTMAADSIHVSSKEKPGGLIVATLDEADKAATANALVRSLAGALREYDQLAYGLIHEYCWLLFEVDLKRTRRAVEDLRRSSVIDVEAQRLPDRPDTEKRVLDRVRALNTALQQRFEVVSSWLTRPNNVSPSASVILLFHAVLDEVRQRYPQFNPQLDVGGAEDVELLGHRFHFFYDALYILIDNAAKHGRPHGTLGINVATRRGDDNFIYLTVSVASDLDETGTRQSEQIEEAMSAAIGDAMVQDQGSGLRKLRSLADDVEEIIGFDWRYHERSVHFTIEMRYPLT
jgi:hypothetical protein